jgi:hypothetical protein
MKNLFLPIIIVLAFIVGINAGTRYSVQEGASLEGKYLAYGVTADMSESLVTLDEIKANVNLTDNQVISVDSILTDATTKLQGVTDTGDSGKQAKTKIVSDAYSAIRSLLTDEQKSKFDVLVAQKKGNPGMGKD